LEEVESGEEEKDWEGCGGSGWKERGEKEREEKNQN
jgi:hypothetical protein